MKYPLQYPRDEEVVRYPFYLPHVLHVQDARKQRLVGPRQQSQSTCGLARVFGGTHAGEKHCHDFTLEFVGIVRVFDHRLGDDAHEGADDGICDNSFDVRDVETQGKKTQCEDAVMVLRQSKVDNLSS